MAWRRAWTIGGAALGALALPGSAAAERVVFVNLDPVVLVNTAGQDPTQNSYNTMGFVPGPASGWPGLTDDQRTELLYWLKEASVPFDIIYTFERPAAGTYDMVVTGTAADNAALFPALGCSAAIGLADCNDGNAENVSFFFWGCLDAAEQADMHRVAFTTFAALGFGWGLENLTGTGQIMAGYTPTSLEFGDVCTNISGTSNCAGGHVGCPANQQNSTADLLDRIGPRVDDGPPTVTILEPADGTSFEAGVPVIDVDAAVGDLFGGLAVELEIVEAAQTQLDEQPPYHWTLAGIPDGMWTLRVNATDADGNLVSQQVVVCVGLPECVGSGSTGADGTTAGVDDSAGAEFSTEVFDPSTSTSSSTGGEPEPPPVTSSGPPIDPTSLGGDTPDTGCQCRSGGSGAAGGAVWSLGLLLLVGGLIRRE
jgi:MYXO-CTERM domain-containing protein